MIARLHQWIGLHGGENGVTLLMYEAHKALVKLRAPVADDPEAFENAWKNRPYLIMGVTDKDKAQRWWQAGRAAMASAPVAGEAQPGDADILALSREIMASRCDGRSYDARIISFSRTLLSRYAASQANEAVRDARGVLEAWQAVCDRIVDQYGGVVAGVDFAALGRTNRAALSAQPGAQKEQSDEN